jgi:hypothetical protein
VNGRRWLSPWRPAYHALGSFASDRRQQSHRMSATTIETEIVILLSTRRTDFPALLTIGIVV